MKFEIVSVSCYDEKHEGVYAEELRFSKSMGYPYTPPKRFEEAYPELARFCKKIENKYFMDIKTIEELQKVYELAGIELIIKFNPNQITIYDGYIE